MRDRLLFFWKRQWEHLSQYFQLANIFIDENMANVVNIRIRMLHNIEFDCGWIYALNKCNISENWFWWTVYELYLVLSAFMQLPFSLQLFYITFNRIHLLHWFVVGIVRLEYSMGKIFHHFVDFMETINISNEMSLKGITTAGEQQHQKWAFLCWTLSFTWKWNHELGLNSRPDIDS